MSKLPDPLQINFGQGKVRISSFNDEEGVGLIFFPDNHAHVIGAVDNSLVGPHIPHKGEVYFYFSNLESLDVVIEELEIIRQQLKS